MSIECSSATEISKKEGESGRKNLNQNTAKSPLAKLIETADVRQDGPIPVDPASAEGDLQ
jgi:hypothetical protein